MLLFTRQSVAGAPARSFLTYGMLLPESWRSVCLPITRGSAQDVHATREHALSVSHHEAPGFCRAPRAFCALATVVGAATHRGRGWGGASRGRAARRGGGRGVPRRIPPHARSAPPQARFLRAPEHG